MGEQNTGNEWNAGNAQNTGNEWNAGNAQNTGNEWNAGNAQNTGNEWNAGNAQNTGNEWNAGNAQNTGDQWNMGGQQNRQTGQYSYYQDNTANMPPYRPAEEPPETTYVTNGMQIASLVCGIVGIVLGCCCIPYGLIVGIVLGIIGLVLAIVGNRQSRSGIGTGGLVCSIIALVLSIVVLIAIVLLLFLAGTVDPGMMQDWDYFY